MVGDNTLSRKDAVNGPVRWLYNKLTSTCAQLAPTQGCQKWTHVDINLQGQNLGFVERDMQDPDGQRSEIASSILGQLPSLST